MNAMDNFEDFEDASVVCTVFDGDYYFGVLALGNSLVASGFRGKFLICYRGALEGKIDDEVIRAFEKRDLFLVFERISFSGHLTNYKPYLISHAALRCPRAPKIYYLDPDIVVDVRWDFFEDWTDGIISLFCDDLWHPMFDSHPKKLHWERLAREFGFVSRRFHGYACAGFIGVPREYLSFVELWAALIVDLERTGHFSSNTFHSGLSTDPFMAMDQDVLNFALHVSDVPFSLAAPQNQGTVANGAYIAHAQGSPKPWRGGLIGDALFKGKRPSFATRRYWSHVSCPVQVHSRFEIWLAQIRIGFATLLARLFG